MPKWITPETIEAAEVELEKWRDGPGNGPYFIGMEKDGTFRIDARYIPSEKIMEALTIAGKAMLIKYNGQEPNLDTNSN